MSPKRRSLLMSLTLLAAVAVGCGDDDEGEAAPEGGTQDASEVSGTVFVFAAASLTDAFEELAADFEAANPGAEVELNLAGSSTLREQVLGGAPADVFASADIANMDPVVEAGAADGDPEVFVRNVLEIAVAAGNPEGVTGLDDLTRDELFVGLCAEEVPCGRFAREVLDAAGVEPALDTNEPDVRSLLTKLALGELDVGMVYRTDVLSEPEVEGIPVPDDVSVVADYPITALAEAPNAAGAAAFVDLVLSAAGQEVLASYGFQTE